MRLPFARISKNDIARLEAEALNRAIGGTYRVAISTHHLDRALSEVAVGPAVRLEPGKARGAYIRRKGGVIPGARVF